MAMNGRFVPRDPTRSARIGIGLLCLAALGCVVLILVLRAPVAGRLSEGHALRAEVDRLEMLRDRAAEAGPVDLAIAAESPRDAQSRMQVALQALADTHELEIETIRAVQTEGAIGGMETVGLVLTGALPEPALEAFLAGLPDLQPFIEVVEVDLRRARILSRAEDARRIAIRLSVRGYLA